MRTLVLIGLLASLPAAACSSSGSGTSAAGSCNPTDLCSKVTVSQANATCGMTATTATPFDGPGPAAGASSSVCRLEDGTGMVGELERHCFHDASGASAFYQTTHDAPHGSGVAQVDVPGVGDRADYRDDPALGEATLHVLSGNLVAAASDNETGGDDKSACLAELANAIIAAR